MFGLDLGQVKVKALVGLLLISLLGSPIAGVAAAQEDTYDGPASITADQLVVDGDVSISNSTQQLFVDTVLSSNQTALNQSDLYVEIYDMNGSVVDTKSISVNSTDANMTASASWETPSNLPTGDYEIVVWSNDPSIASSYEIGTLDSTTLIGTTGSGDILNKEIYGIPVIGIGFAVVVVGLLYRES